MRKYLSSSEAVSSGHPDRLADNLAAMVIGDIQSRDGLASHAAIEVFITHTTIIFSGECKTTLDIDDAYLREVVRKGFNMSGYFRQMRKWWTKDEVMLAEDFEVVNQISAQSPDIALGTTDKGDDSGWNDQGVYFSSSESTTKSRMGTAHEIAVGICEHLKSLSGMGLTLNQKDDAYDGVILGPDNKCVVTVEVGEDGYTPISVKAITIAAAHREQDAGKVRGYVREQVETWLEANSSVEVADDCVWTINGTGRFVVHGPVSDTSMTGRKISVNHPTAGPLWSNKMIGGGSLVKPAHASDLLLNVAARFVANVIVASGISRYAVVGCSGAIGAKGLQSLFIKGDDEFESSLAGGDVEKFFLDNIDWSPAGLTKMFGFFKDNFVFAEIVDGNFYGKAWMPWESDSLITPLANKLIEYIK